MSKHRPLDPLYLLQHIRHQHITDKVVCAALTNAIDHIIGIGWSPKHNPRSNTSNWKFHYQQAVIWRNALERMNHER